MTGEDSIWPEADGVDQVPHPPVPHRMAALIEYFTGYAKPLRLPGLDPPEPDAILWLDDLDTPELSS